MKFLIKKEQDHDTISWFIAHGFGIKEILYHTNIKKKVIVNWIKNFYYEKNINDTKDLINKINHTIKYVVPAKITPLESLILKEVINNGYITLDTIQENSKNQNKYIIPKKTFPNIYIFFIKKRKFLNGKPKQIIVFKDDYIKHLLITANTYCNYF